MEKEVKKMRLSTSLAIFCLAVFVTLIWHPTTVKAQGIEDGLAGHWTFDEKDTDAKETKDALGEFNGTIMGNPEIVEGKVGEALSFNGVDDYVVMGAVTEGIDLTYAMWIKPEKLAMQVIFWDDDSNGGGDSWVELLADGTIQTQRAGDGFGVFKTTTPIEPGEWTHITFVADGENDTKILYLNGKPDAEASGIITTRDNVSHVVVAVGHDSNAFIKPNYFAGLIDDVAIYLRALTEDEVKKNIATRTAVDSVGKLSITWGAIKTR
jgi:hypothetical protein